MTKRIMMTRISFGFPDFVGTPGVDEVSEVDVEDKNLKQLIRMTDFFGAKLSKVPTPLSILNDYMETNTRPSPEHQKLHQKSRGMGERAFR